jgi:hypothetical protein
MNKLISRVTLLLAAAAAVLLLAGMPGNEMKVKAGTSTGDFTVTGEDSNYSFSGSTLTITGSGPVTISNNNPGTTTDNRIVVDSSAGAKITLSNVNIKADHYQECAFYIKSSSGNVEVTLAAGTTNKLTSGKECAGLQEDRDYRGTLTIDGSGTLIAASGSDGAGIGGGNGASGNNIYINGGNVTATGSGFAAGIGGGNGASGNNIYINGGNVTATGSSGGAGIGGGNGALGNNIYISGGTVSANTGANGGAGIGGGLNGAGTYITISGGTVSANGGAYGGAGIGGGLYGAGTYITISGGTVSANGGANGGAGIGGGSGNGGSGSNITISGGNVTATGAGGGAGIGSGNSGSSSNDIKIAPASGSIAVEEGDSAGNISKRYTRTYPETYSYDSQPYGGTLTYIHTEPTDVDLGSTASSGSGSGSPCTHDYEWTVYSEATPTEDGKWALQCTKCGDIKAWQPISAYGAFNIAAYDKIKAAKAGSSVTVETPIFNSFTKAVMDEIITRKDVTVNVRYYAKGHEHQQFSIPAGTDLGKLADVKYYGFEYLKGIAPATVQKIR